VEFRVLGPVEVLDDGRRVAVPAKRVRTLLALLLIRPNRVVPADDLVDALWVDADAPARPRAAMQTYVSRLRSYLGTPAGELLRTDPAGYQLVVRPDQLDLLRFRAQLDQANRLPDDPAGRIRHLSAALDQWRGEPLSGVYSSPPIRAAVTGLTDDHLHAVEQLYAARLELGQYAEAVSGLSTLVTAHPLRERPWALLIRALHHSGRQADAMDAYQRIRQNLREQLGSDPGDELERAHQAVLAGTAPDAAAHQSAPGPPATRPIPPPPRQLPADIERFTGRGDDLAVLERLLPDGSSDDWPDHRPIVIAAVDGAAGIGKTALAVHWAHRVKDRFPDGQLYLNLRGYGPSRALDPGDAIEAMLGSLGTPAEQIPPGLDGRSALLRTQLAGKRMLVLLDNARDIDQVRPLLPGAGSLVLVTSRSQLRGLAVRDGAHRLTLDHLSERESIDLLVRVIGDRAAAEPSAVAELAGLCGGLPLALALAAERATREPSSPLADLAEDLRDERARLDVLGTDEDPASDLRGVFSWSYRAVSVEAAALFRLLGIAPGPDLGIDAAATLAGCGRARAQRLLDQLVRANLLQSKQPGRFEIHDLLRSYAIELAHRHDRAEDREAAIRRLLRWYNQSAFHARNTLHVGETSVAPDPPVEALTFSSGSDAVSWYSVERPNLLASARMAYDHQYYDLCWQLAFALWVHSQLVRAWDTIADLHALGLRSAHRLGDPRAVAHMLTGIGTAHRAAGRLETAARVQRRAIALFRSSGDRSGEATALSNLGAVYRDLGRYEEALVHSRAALALDEARDEPGNMSISHYQIAQTLNAAGRYDEAVDAAKESLTLGRRLGRRRGVARALQALATTLHRRGDHAGAIDASGEAVSILRELGDRQYQASALIQHGDALDAAGRPDAARPAWQQALAILDELGAPDAQAARDRLHPRDS
jgi:DNA-binding SARP family transcriptional activator/tetratricopeptide (TPR) repeat protein